VGGRAVTDFRVVVVGAGLVARFWLPALQAARGVELAALVEPDAGRARETVARHGLTCPVHARLDDALDEAAPNLLVNLTPPAAHRAVVEQAFDRGCHVFGEKPMATTLEDARALVERAERTGLTFALMQNRRFQPGIRRLGEGIAAGAIGDPVLVCADMFMGARHSNTYLESIDSPLLMEMAVHAFDQARFLSRAEPVSVQCDEIDPPNSWYAGPAAAVCTFELSGGAVFSYRASWVAHGFETSYDAAWRISGTRGTAVWDSYGDPACEAAEEGTEATGGAPVRRERWPAAAPRDATGHAECFDAVLAALRDGRRPETDCTDNIRSLAMVFAALRSARERRRVMLDEL
jgi:predicted dehydrogenase